MNASQHENHAISILIIIIVDDDDNDDASKTIAKHKNVCGCCAQNEWGMSICLGALFDGIKIMDRPVDQSVKPSRFTVALSATKPFTVRVVI